MVDNYQNVLTHEHHSIEILQTLPREKVLLEYLPVIAKPPEYDVCKQSLGYLSNLVKELEKRRIQPHADEQAYARPALIIRKHPKGYEDAIILLGGFHQLRVLQRIIYKRNAFVKAKHLHRVTQDNVRLKAFLFL